MSITSGSLADFVFIEYPDGNLPIAVESLMRSGMGYVMNVTMNRVLYNSDG